MKGRYGNVASEACEAAESGANVVFIDTGKPDDVRAASGKTAPAGIKK